MTVAMRCSPSEDSNAAGKTFNSDPLGPDATFLLVPFPLPFLQVIVLFPWGYKAEEELTGGTTTTCHGLPSCLES